MSSSNPPDPNSGKNDQQQRIWPPSLLTPPPTPQPNYNNWQWPSTQQQFQYSYGQIYPTAGQHFGPPVWQHQHYVHQNYIRHNFLNNNQHYHHPSQNQENWVKSELRKLLNMQQETNKELTKEKNELEGQIKELWAKLETSEKAEREAKMKFEKNNAELDELKLRNAEKECQKESKATETDPIEFEHPLPSPDPDHSADELLKLKEEELIRLKSEFDVKNELIRKMETEMRRAKEELEKFIEEQKNGDEERAKKTENLREWEERLKARETRFTEEKEFAIAHCRSESDALVTQIQLQIVKEKKTVESQEREIGRIRGLHRQTSRQLRDSELALEDSKSMNDHLLDEIYFEKEKLKKQFNRYDELKAELAAKNQRYAQKEAELKAKNEEIAKMAEKHEMAMHLSLDAYSRALRQHDESIQKLKMEIEEKKREMAEKEEKFKTEEGENWQILILAEGDRDRLKQEKEELGERASKAMANAEMHKHKFNKIRGELATANEEIGKMRNELARVKILERLNASERDEAIKVCKEKQNELDKLEAEMEKNKKKPELILRFKREIPSPKSSFDEEITAAEKKEEKKEKVKKVGTGGKKPLPQYERDSDYEPPVKEKKRRMEPQNNQQKDPRQPSTSSSSTFSFSAPSASRPKETPKILAKLKTLKKTPMKLRKSIGDEALLKMGSSAYFLRQRGQTVGATMRGKGMCQMEQENYEKKMSEFLAKRCKDHLYSEKCEKCRQKYGL